MTPRKDLIYFAGATGPEASGGCMTTAFVATTQTPHHHETNHMTEGPDCSWHAATYHALASAVQWWSTTKDPVNPIFVTDNQLVVKQLSGAWRAKGGHYTEALEDALDALASAFPKRGSQVRLSWVPFTQNLAAPMANALLQQHGIIPWSYKQEKKT